MSKIAKSWLEKMMRLDSKELETIAETLDMGADFLSWCIEDAFSIIDRRERAYGDIRSEVLDEVWQRVKTDPGNAEKTVLQMVYEDNPGVWFTLQEQRKSGTQQE